MKFQDVARAVSFLLVLATVCAATFWLVLHSKEKAFVDRQMAFQSMAGRTAPDFRLTTIDGRTVDSSRLKRPLVLEIFATWCDICQNEVPTLNRLRSFHGVDIVAVSGDKRGLHGQPESINDLRAFKNRFGVRYEIAFDPKIEIAHHYQIVGFPSIYIIEPNGRIDYNTAGQTSLVELAQHLPRQKCSLNSVCT